ncbi:hypothetical protein [Legionella bozemanae]|uniref:hypothetical protein n=1 Tax=Legionella bozemanae TaxID=447 RepID=UPI000AE0F72D|nr:hypothetical protein [Legionella bozemanae]
MASDNEYNEYSSGYELKLYCLRVLREAYNRGGPNELRLLNRGKKNRYLNDELKKIKEELLPLAYFLEKEIPIPGVSKILIPINISNQGFDARICTQGEDDIFIEVTSTLDGKRSSSIFSINKKLKRTPGKINNYKPRRRNRTYQKHYLSKSKERPICTIQTNIAR